MIVRTACRVLVLASAGLGWVTSASAQARFEAGPLVGLYAPLGEFGPAAYYSTGLPSSPSDLTGLALGAQGRFWIRPRLGVQLDGAVASSHIGPVITPGGGVSPIRSVRVFTGAAQVLYNLAPSSGSKRLWLSAGGGLVHHGGAAYMPYQGRSHLAGVFGIGATIPLLSRLSFNAGLTTFLYSMAVRDSLGVLVEHGTQVDARFQTGITWSWW